MSMLPVIIPITISFAVFFCVRKLHCFDGFSEIFVNFLCGILGWNCFFAMGFISACFLLTNAGYEVNFADSYARRMMNAQLAQCVLTSPGLGGLCGIVIGYISTKLGWSKFRLKVKTEHTEWRKMEYFSICFLSLIGWTVLLLKGLPKVTAYSTFN